jgi:HAD superfamily hydrolase (TIGR01509 family)
MTAKLVLFDCDGVLINTEEIGYRLVHGMLAEQGLRYTREEYVGMLLGITYKQFLDKIVEEFRTRLDREPPDGFAEEISYRLRHVQDTQMRALDGVVQMLQGLKRAGVPFAVASNSTREGLERKLRQTGLYDYFLPHIYCKDDVEHPKPAPDLYLHAAADMGGFLPHECVVVEDSVTGAMAGIAAGMEVIGFIGEAHRVDTEADYLLAAGVSEVVHGADRLLPVLLTRAGRGFTPPAPVPGLFPQF